MITYFMTDTTSSILKDDSFMPNFIFIAQLSYPVKQTDEIVCRSVLRKRLDLGSLDHYGADVSISLK